MGPGLGSRRWWKTWDSTWRSRGWHRFGGNSLLGLVEIVFYLCKPGFVSQTMYGSGGVVCCLLKGDAQF